MRWTAIALVVLVGGCVGSSENPMAERAALSQSKLSTTTDEDGTLATFSTNAFDPGASNGFFTPLGSNGRACASCHRQADAWTISASSVQALAKSDPTDPLFSPIDGSDCPATSPSGGPHAAASTLLTGYGLIRIQLAVPAGADFTLAAATNPKGCAIPPGGAALTGALFLFRRPLPTVSLTGLSTVMWDGRETLQAITTHAGLTGLGPLEVDLADQDDGAVLGHEQGGEKRDLVAFLSAL